MLADSRGTQEARRLPDAVCKGVKRDGMDVGPAIAAGLKMRMPRKSRLFSIVVTV